MFEAAKKKINLVAQARKLFSGGSFDQALCVMEEMGISVAYDEIPCDRKLTIDELSAIADAAVQPGAKLFKAKIAKEGYPDLVAFMVLKGS